MAKKAPPVVEFEEEEEDVTCPVCGKPVGLEVTTCPYCGAEFEEEEAEEEVAEAVEEKPKKAPAPVAPAAPAVPAVQKAAPAPVEEDETAECPVCGKPVSLSVSSCPFCGAEFEEEEVEEVIEVEEAPSAKEEAVAEEVDEKEVEAAEPEKVVEVEETNVSGLEFEESTVPTARAVPLIDLKVIGVSLIALGIIGSQISVFIDWYWTWVPPIGDNLVMFIAIPTVIIVAALAFFMYIRRSSSKHKKLPKSAPGTSLSIVLFGIIAMIMIMLWRPINDALQDSSVTVAGAFFAILAVGILVVFMGVRTSAKAAA